MHIKRKIYILHIYNGELLQLIQCIDVFILHRELEITKLYDSQYN